MNPFQASSNYYDLLDISKSASPSEIRAAYLRAKTTFNRSNMAAYSLLNESENTVMMQEIEKAYDVLSHPEKKLRYDSELENPVNADLLHGMLDTAENPEQSIFSTISIPMNSTISAEPDSAPGFVQEIVAESESAEQPLDSFPTPVVTARSTREPSPAVEAITSTSAAELTRYSPEKVLEWSGKELRAARQARGVELERLVEITRIRKSYLNAIENEEFQTLPSRVFVRGFLQQLARELKIPSEQLLQTYLARFDQWTISHSNKTR
ncbi:MAG: hypothetical protein RJB38_1489 [Pseudomonadota bacterium]